MILIFLSGRQFSGQFSGRVVLRGRRWGWGLGRLVALVVRLKEDVLPAELDRELAGNLSCGPTLTTAFLKLRKESFFIGLYLNLCYFILAVCLSFFLSFCLSVCPFVCLSVFLNIRIPAKLDRELAGNLSCGPALTTTFLNKEKKRFYFCLSVILSFYLSVFLSFCLSVFLSFWLYVILSFCHSVSLSLCLYVFMSLSLSFYSVYLNIYTWSRSPHSLREDLGPKTISPISLSLVPTLSFCLPICQSVYLNIDTWSRSPHSLSEDLGPKTMSPISLSLVPTLSQHLELDPPEQAGWFSRTQLAGSSTESLSSKNASTAFRSGSWLKRIQSC